MLEKKSFRLLKAIIFSSFLFLVVAEKLHAQTVADTVYTNGKIYTVNKARSWEEAIAIKDGRYLFVGSGTEAQKYIGSSTEVIDLKGGFVTPGFHDLHTHALEGYIAEIYDCNFSPRLSIENIIDTVEACIKEHPEKKWIIGGAWMPSLLDDYKGRSVRELLDEVAGDRAVYLRDFSGHHAIVNSKTLELGGYDESTTFPGGGQALKDPKTGKLNGFLTESAAFSLGKLIPVRTVPQQIEDLKVLVHRLNSYGLTGWKEAFAEETLLRVYSQLDKQQMLTAYVGASQGIKNEHIDVESLVDRRQKYTTKHFKTDFAKILLDGVPPTRTAFMLKPYLPDEKHGHDWHSGPMLSKEVFESAMIKLDKEGFTVKIHASGDASARMVLDAVEKVRINNGPSNRIHEVSHAMYVEPVDVPRFKQLNVAAELSPMLWKPDIVVHTIIPPALGNEGLKMFPVKDFIAAGAHVIPGTDWPVAASMDPLLGFEALVTRKNPESGVFYRLMDWWWGPLWPEQKIDVATAMDFYTINSTRSLNLEDRTGSIEQGKSADFVVWDQNFFEIKPSEISETKVLRTVFEGKVAYQ